MAVYTENPAGNQAASPTDNSDGIHPRRKGVEIVVSAFLPGQFFHGPRPGRNFPIWNDDENWVHRVATAEALR